MRFQRRPSLLLLLLSRECTRTRGRFQEAHHRRVTCGQHGLPGDCLDRLLRRGALTVPVRRAGGEPADREQKYRGIVVEQHVLEPRLRRHSAFVYVFRTVSR